MKLAEIDKILCSEKFILESSIEKIRANMDEVDDFIIGKILNELKESGNTLHDLVGTATLEQYGDLCTKPFSTILNVPFKLLDKDQQRIVIAYLLSSHLCLNYWGMLWKIKTIYYK